MLLKYFYDEELAQASYLVGCPGSGEALVVDPGRDIRPYLQVAEQEGLRIVGVAETHIHADYVSGGHELAHAAGATLYVSGEGRDFKGGEFAYALPDDVKVKPVMHNQVIAVGGVRLRVMHSPGHTPEHVMYLLTDTGATEPMGIFGGDCLFVGDVGRPDLLEEAVGVADTREQGARQQFANVEAVKALPDYLQIWPGHGAGSACGKALGAVPSSTVGYEKLYNPAFQFSDADSFAAWLLADQPAAPLYFKQMKAVNQQGAALVETLMPPTPWDLDALRAGLDDGLLVIDTRPAAMFAAGYLPGTVNVPADERQFNTWVGWLVDYSRPIGLIVPDAAAVDALLPRLRAIGVDDVAGFLIADDLPGDLATVTQIDPADAQRKADAGEALIVDVRWVEERREDFIPGSHYLPLHRVLERVAELPTDRTIIPQCGGGVRSQIAACLLQNAGLRVLNLSGGIDAWKQAGLPVNVGDAAAVAN